MSDRDSRQSERVCFTLDGAPVEVAAASDESLLSVLRERLGAMSVKDGCAPQGQCGCCTVLVDGEPRVACVTPAARVAGREVTTVDGLDAGLRDALVDAFVATGGSQCGFCTPGIVVRLAARARRGSPARRDLDRALAAHLCRCTGWLTIYDATATATTVASGATRSRTGRDLAAAACRAELEGGGPQRVGSDGPLGRGGFADDLAPRDALVAVPRSPGSSSTGVAAAGIDWAVGDTLREARERAGTVPGRRSTVPLHPPLPAPPLPDGGVRIVTGWVEPAYLEPDASWCKPGGEPASPLANGGAFGAKLTSVAPTAARELAERLGRTVRVVLSREDVVRLGPKRPPIAATAVLRGQVVVIRGTVVEGGEAAYSAPPPACYSLSVDATWATAQVLGPPVSPHLRAAGLAEQTLLVEGAIDSAGADRGSLLVDERVARVALATVAGAPGGALAGARVAVDAATGAVLGVRVRVAAGDPLDDTVLRSYALGAAHMALGWVLAEGIAVAPETGDVHDLTIRSFGIIRARDVPPIDVEVLDDSGAARPRSSDAVFAAVAAATWNAVAAVDAVRPDTFPARDTRAGRALRR